MAECYRIAELGSYCWSFQHFLVWYQNPFEFINFFLKEWFVQKTLDFWKHCLYYRSQFQSFPLWVMNSWAVIDTMKTVENLVYWKPFLVICPKSHFASIKDLHIQSKFTLFQIWPFIWPACIIYSLYGKWNWITLLIPFLNLIELPSGDLKKKIGPWWEDCTETWNLRPSTEKWNNWRILPMKIWIQAEVVLF